MLSKTRDHQSLEPLGTQICAEYYFLCPQSGKIRSRNTLEGDKDDSTRLQVDHTKYDLFLFKNQKRGLLLNNLNVKIVGLKSFNHRVII